jgi:hypothetical protein
MIIFGTRSKHAIRGAGAFHCPCCGPSRPYAHNEIKRWFTLYFIPLIPLGSAGTYVQCGRCASTFHEDVLSRKRQSDPTDLRAKLHGLLVLVMLANRHPVDAAEIQAIRDFYRETTNTALSEQNVRESAAHVLAEHMRLGEIARAAAASLTPSAKAIVLRGAYRVLSAKSAVRADAQAVLAELAQALGISAQQMQETLRVAQA